MWEGWGGPGREDESVVLVKAVLYGTLFSFLLTLLSVCRSGFADTPLSLDICVLDLLCTTMIHVCMDICIIVFCSSRFLRWLHIDYILCLFRSEV